MNRHFQTPLALAFYNGHARGRWLDRVIARHDRGRFAGPFSHVELVFNLDHGPVCFSSSFRDGGVRLKRIDLDSKWTTVELVAGRAEAERLRQWCRTKLGGRYDLPGVLAFKLPWVRPKLNWWFCSEICSAAVQRLRHCPPALRHHRPEDVSPNKLFHLCTETP